MANLWDIPDFDYQTHDELLGEMETLRAYNPYYADSLLSMANGDDQEEKQDNKLVRLAPTSLYGVDGITRRAPSLQETQDAQVAVVKINSTEANARQLTAEQKVWVVQDGVNSRDALPIDIDDRIPMGAVLVAASIAQTQTLGAPFGLVELKINT
jgi:NADH-quinone oxidoreductase subunit G